MVVGAPRPQEEQPGGWPREQRPPQKATATKESETRERPGQARPLQSQKRGPRDSAQERPKE